MSISGLFYILGEYGIPTGSVMSLYDFSDSGNLSNKANLAYNGSLVGVSGSFWSQSGYASFSNHSVLVDTGRNVPLTNFSVLMIGSGRVPTTRETMFSTALENSSGIASGFAVYRNNIGNLSFAFKDCSGVQCCQSNFSTIGPFAVGVSRQDAILHFLSYDYSTDTIDSKTFTVDTFENIFPSFPSYIGKVTNGQISGIPNDNYNGRMDYVTITSGGLDSANAALFFSGIYQNISGIPLPATTGNIFEGFWNSNATTTVLTDYNPTEIFKTKNAILILSQSITASDLVTFDLATERVSNVNKQISYSSYSNTEILQAVERGRVAMWLNGQRLISGAAIQTGVFCQRGMLYPHDYDIKRNVVLSPQPYSSSDACIYDSASTSFIPQSIIGSGTDTFVVDTTSGISVFINGLRTHDFEIVVDTVSFNTALGATDKVCIDYFNKGKWNLANSGTSQLINVGSGFYDSCVYLNGQRLVKNSDYVEIYNSQNALLQFGEMPSTKIFETLAVDETYDS